jgi:hypothetical protein
LLEVYRFSFSKNLIFSSYSLFSFVSENMIININDEHTLRTKIENFTLDDPNAALNFTQRLAKENNWDIEFAKRVVTEYKRYVFLCAISPEQISPSEEVDQAWHMHMTYTESYWTDLCVTILGKPLHHHPTRGGPEEREKFFALYENTLAFYREKFNEDPPPDIWPPAEKRFSHTHFIRVDKSTHWVISKPRTTETVVKIISINLIAAVMCIVSGNWVFLVISFVATLIATSSVSAGFSGGSSSGSGCWSGSACGGGDDGGSGCGGGCGGCGGGCG